MSRKTFGRSGLVLLAALVVLSAPFMGNDGTAHAQEKGADPALVKRYMELSPSSKKMVTEMLHRLSAQKGRGGDTQQQVDQLLALVDFKRIDKAIADSVARHYSNKELEAITDFLGSTEGRSYITKQPLLSQDISRALQEEFSTALKKLQESKSTNKNRGGK
jgi:hypothetical protein